MIGIDLFAGAGGFTEGAEQAGVKIVWAGNHWRLACDWYAANHPLTVPKCQDLQQADWREVPSHDIQLSSPACQGHSPARGKDRPHHDEMRSTAWAVVSCAEYHRSQLIIIENVPEFLNWSLYPAFENALHLLGYSVAPHILDAADHGVPQNRERLFLVCSLSKNPLWLKLPKRPHTPIANVIQWDAYPWNPIDRPGRSLSTLRRAAAGRAEFGDRFVAPFYGCGSGLKGRSIDRPIGTITTRDRWAVFDGDRMRMLQITEYMAGMGFPSGYKLPLKPKRLAIHLLGNAVPPAEAADILNAVRSAA
jgi:DNA (cytosine-5)-methyltransferase 1